MAKLKPNEKRLHLSFQRPDDLRLWDFMAKRAYECRWELSTFILASLQDAFRGQIDEAEVDAVAEEALRKVRERAAVSPETPPMPVVAVTNHAAEPTAISPDEAYEQALKQVAALNEQTMKQARTGTPVPPTPPAPAPSSMPATGKPQTRNRKKTAS